MLVVCDALNYLNRFVPAEESAFDGATPSLLFAEAHARVSEFADALKAARVDITFVFDNGQKSEEANEKWIERRRKEVEFSCRKIPLNASDVLWSMLEERGFKIYSPSNMDGDDAVARLAMKFNAYVLSKDQDMMRYGLPRGRVLSDFAVRGGHVSFLTRYNQPKIPLRDVSTIECSDLSTWEVHGSTLRILAIDKVMRFGNSDSHTRTFGNLYEIARPLRAAFYARLDVTVTETLPVWRNGVFKLESCDVAPDGALDDLLDDASAMFRWIITNDSAVETYEDRKHGAAMIAAELYDAVHDQELGINSRCRIVNVYKSILPFGEVPDMAKKDWAFGGRCTGLRNKPCLGDGLCFPMQIEYAKYLSKDPLCAECLNRLFEIIELRKVRKQMQNVCYSSKGGEDQ